MIDDCEYAPLEQVVQFRPAQIRRRAQELRERSRQCADLASNCLTEQGKQVLHGIATELGGEADELEGALLMIRRNFAETFENESTDLTEA